MIFHRRKQTIKEGTVQDRFFEQPILNSPYEYPTQYWELDEDGQPTYRIIDGRRNADFVTPIPKPKRTKVSAQQARLALDNGSGLSDRDQLYDISASVNQIRSNVDGWRTLPGPDSWGVTPETARLLQHWRSHPFSSYRPFFCQVEAIETLIWLTEVAPKLEAGRRMLQRLSNANKEANPALLRIALKLATGAGKTTVMAMIIAWQTINALRRPQSVNFTRGFLVVAPGITIRDRLRVLQPNDPDSDDGRGDDDLLNLVVEIKGYRGEDAKEKKTTMETYWVPGVNGAGEFGRWAFAEFTDVYEIGADFAARVEAAFNKTIAQNVGL